jgi:hypothetical protein
VSRAGTLFADASLRDALEQQKDGCRSQILKLPEDELFQRSAEEWAARFIKEYQVEPLTIHSDQMRLEDRGECAVWGPGGLVTSGVRVHQGGGVPGRAVTVHVPFSGDEHLLGLQPSTYGSSQPQANIGTNELLFRFEYPSGSQPDIKAQVEQLLRSIEEPYLRSQTEDVSRFNQELEALATQGVVERRQRILQDREHIDGLGIPVYRRDDAPKTYSATGIERRPSPKAPPAKAQEATRMEPTLVEDFYRHIIEVIGAMARGMERNPGDYATWPEEKLRDALLVILNTHYKGQATGETFNKSGKTDVLVRVEDRNVFVGECKWWSGPSSFASPDKQEQPALDQLLSYATWRDPKLALTVFVDNKDVGKVIASAREALEKHPAFIQWTDASDEEQLRCRVRLSGDDGRSADLAVIFVHLPKD